MRLKILFTALIILLGIALTYDGTPFLREILKENPDAQEGRVEDAGESQNTGEMGEGNLSAEELPTIPRAPEAKPVEPKKEVSTPPPLKLASPPEPEPKPESAPLLTQSGIILQTNLRRQENGLGFLKGDATLNAMAGEKANDMCERQYFAHVSPSGDGVGDLADSFGYGYLSVGENLALGSFAGDEILVEAWMNSPGHRANILNSRFTEIGVGVVRCIFDGRSTWLAVQHFGKPASDCPRPSSALKGSIDENKLRLTDMRDELIVLKLEIEASDPNTDPNYNTKVGTYNSLVKEYNGLIGENRILINQYNSQVAEFNACAEG